MKKKLIKAFSGVVMNGLNTPAEYYKAPFRDICSILDRISFLWMRFFCSWFEYTTNKYVFDIVPLYTEFLQLEIETVHLKLNNFDLQLKAITTSQQ